MSETMASAGGPITMTSIGVVRRAFDNPDSVVGREATIEELRAERVAIVVEARYADGLLGLEPGADILVLCHLDRADRDLLQVHPRGDTNRPMRGVFATRSPARPNPISVTSARLLDIEGATLSVIGLDVLDGTPVLDIKSHSQYFDEPYTEG
jgi:tRNA-Thr(GGU) m(6)t(6)A37 methyltransferase TsaA